MTGRARRQQRKRARRQAARLGQWITWPHGYAHMFDAQSAKTVRYAIYRRLMTPRGTLTTADLWYSVRA